MTIWRYREEKGKGYYTPRRHDPSLQMWREFSTIAVQDVSHHRPGVLSWIDYLTRNNILNGNKKVKFNIISVQYGDKDFFVTDAFNEMSENDWMNYCKKYLSEQHKGGEAREE